MESQLILEAEPPDINNIDLMIGTAEEEMPSNSICTNCVNNELKIATLKYELDDCKKKLTDCEINYTKLKRKVEKSKVKYFNFSSLTDDNMVNLFTGMATFSIFSWLLNRIKPHVKLFHKSLSLEDHLLIVLMKLKLGLLNKDIAQRFGVSSSTITKIFRGWVPIMGSSMKNLIVWPDRGVLRRNLPHSFKKKIRDAVCIIDCSEIFIERPRNLTARAQTLSNYKHNNTDKFLIGISPSGVVSFLSTG